MENSKLIRVKLTNRMRKSMLIMLMFFIFINLHSQNNQSTKKVTGMTMVAPPSPFNSDPMPAIKNTNSEWVALVPYAFIGRDDATVRFGSKRQWWGEREEGTIESIKLAKKNNLKVMIKPQIWMHGEWIGDMDHDNEADWKVWEESYEKYIMTFVDLAIEHDVEMVCVGTEIEKSAQKREKYWRGLIKKIRTKYDGQLTYSSNWDNYKNIPFWDDLDFIGISAYFPLTEAETPSVSFLNYKWNNVKTKLKKYSEKISRPILFTEYGYLSVDGCASKTWILEKKRGELAANQKAQANALEGLYSSFWDEEWWAGGFLWKWYPNGRAQEGRREKDYTPQGKLAEQTIQKWYQKSGG